MITIIIFFRWQCLLSYESMQLVQNESVQGYIHLVSTLLIWFCLFSVGYFIENLVWKMNAMNSLVVVISFSTFFGVVYRMYAKSNFVAVVPCNQVFECSLKWVLLSGVIYSSIGLCMSLQLNGITNKIMFDAIVAMVWNSLYSTSLLCWEMCCLVYTMLFYNIYHFFLQTEIVLLCFRMSVKFVASLLDFFLTITSVMYKALTRKPLRKNMLAMAPLLVVLFFLPSCVSVRSNGNPAGVSVRDIGSLGDIVDTVQSAMQNIGSKLMSAADYVMNKRLDEKTRKSYRGKIATMRIFLMEHRLFNYLDEENRSVVVPLPLQVVQDMFGWISTNTDIPLRSGRKKPSKSNKQGGQEEKEDDEGDVGELGADGEDDDDEVVVDEGREEEQDTVMVGQAQFAASEQTVSVSTMQGYKSALKWLYWEKKVLFPADMDAWLDAFIQAYKKIVAEKKLKGVMPVTEGKKPVSFSGFCFLCKVLMCLIPKGNFYPWKVSVFGWSFETLSWNIIGRCSNVHALMLQHFDWREDALLVTVPKHKGDQTGESLSQVKHVYANPLRPEICPVLALAVLIICRHRLCAAASNANQRLYTEDSMQRFGQILTNLLNDYSLIPEDVNLGAGRRSDLGTHSNRKGAATYLCSLSVCLSAVNIFLRAGWSVGAVQDRYIFAGPGGDQVVGRAAAGLPINNRDFAILPPHFTPAGMDILRKIGFCNCIEGFGLFPCSFQRVVPYLIASIVYHEKFMRENLNPGHPLWNQRLFASPVTVDGVLYPNACKALEGHAVCGWDRDDSVNMQATGIPSHILLSNEISELKRQMKSGIEEVLQEVRLLRNAVSALPEELHSKLPLALRKELLEHFQVDGVTPLTYSDIARLLDERDDRIVARIDEFARLQGNSCSANERPQEVEEFVEGVSGGIFQKFQWGGRLECFVPEGFTFPSKCDVKTMWNLWYFGNSGLKVHPYRKMEPYIAHDLDKHGRVRYSKAKRVMRMIEAEIVKQNLVAGGVEGIGSLSHEAADLVFAHAFGEVAKEFYPNGECRGVEVCIETLTNRLGRIASKKRKAAEVTNAAEAILGLQQRSGRPASPIGSAFALCGPVPESVGSQTRGVLSNFGSMMGREPQTQRK